MAMNLPPDPYKALGLSKTATLPEIRSAHRKLVLKCHPDKVQDAALKAIKQDEFQKVQQAYELLSDDNRRIQYDEQVKLWELRKEMSRGVPTARSNPFEYEVKTAEPRPTTYTYARPKPTVREDPRETSKVYPQQQQPKSYEDFYAEPIRTAKKSASYESADRRQRSSRDDERQRDFRRHEEDERARQKLEKESRRAAHGEKKKSRDKEKKRGVEEKYSTRAGAYVEDDSEDDYRAPRSDKKSSRHKIEEDIKMREEAARSAEKARQAPLTPKWDEHKEYAAQYMQAARQKAVPEVDFHPRPLQRAETFAAPEPKYNIRYAAPQPAVFNPSDDEDLPRRSSAPRVTRKNSDPPSRRDILKSSSKEKEREKDRRKSPRARSRDAYIVEPPSPPPTKMKMPPLQTHSSAPPTIPEYALRKEPSRSKTQDYPRKEQVIPPLPRAATFTPGDRSDRTRGGSKLKKTVDYSSASDEEPIYPSQRRSYSPPPRRRVAPELTREPTRYIIDNGRTVPITTSRQHRADMHNIDDETSNFRDRSPSPRSRHLERPPIGRNGSGGSRQAPTRSKSQYPPEAPEPIVHTVRPPMPPRESHHGHSRSNGRSTGGAFFGEVKYANAFRPEDVVYNDAYRRGSDPSHGHARDFTYAAPPRDGRVYA